MVVTAETEAGLGLGARLTNEALGASSAASSALETALRQDLNARWAAGVHVQAGGAASSAGSTALWVRWLSTGGATA